MEYKAFISYPTDDNTVQHRKWADWLYSQIVNFEVPEALVGTEGDHGIIKREKYNVFLDRTSIKAGDKLNATITKALDNSEYLILVASPICIDRPWVNKEIERFIGLPKEESPKWSKILVAVAESKVQELDREENFPVGLKPLLDSKDSYLFADFRIRDTYRKKWMPGWTHPKAVLKDPNFSAYVPHTKNGIFDLYERNHNDALYKIFGALIGVPPATLDKSKEKETQAKRRRGLVFIAAIAATIAFLAGLSYYFKSVALDNRIEAENHRLMIGDSESGKAELAAELVKASYNIVAKFDKFHSTNPSSPQSEELANQVNYVAIEYFQNVERNAQSRNNYVGLSLALNNTGKYLTLVGELDVAEGKLQKSLEIRKNLLESNENSYSHIHALAVISDALGDLYFQKAIVSRNENQEYEKAEDYYQKSLELSSSIMGIKDAQFVSHHDLATSYFKIAEIQMQNGSVDDALSNYKQGYKHAVDAKAYSKDYEKRDSDLALYTYRIGAAHLARDDMELARQSLTEALRLFNDLEISGKSDPKQETWIEEIEENLQFLNPYQ